MKERLDKLTAILAEEEKVSKLNMVLGLLVALLSGVIVGLLICPKRQRTKYIGCNNGSYNGSRNADDDCCDCEGGKCCEECEEERCCGETEYCGNEKCCCEEGPDDQTVEENKPDEEKEKEYVRIK